MNEATNAPGRPMKADQVQIFQSAAGAWLIDIATTDSYGNYAWSALTSRGFDTYQEAFKWASRSLAFAEV
tara:strand:- start:35822 stop:36031 length:210 start_codon:yes stop_codon:yes gene_type:complete